MKANQVEFVLMVAVWLSKKMFVIMKPLLVEGVEAVLALNL